MIEPSTTPVKRSRETFSCARTKRHFTQKVTRDLLALPNRVPHSSKGHAKSSAYPTVHVRPTTAHSPHNTKQHALAQFPNTTTNNPINAPNSSHNKTPSASYKKLTKGGHCMFLGKLLYYFFYNGFTLVNTIRNTNAFKRAANSVDTG